MTLSMSDGVTTVTLSGGVGVIKACSYFPGTPERNGDGYNDVVESFGVILEGMRADVIAAVNSIEMLLNQATLKRRRSRRLFASYNVAGGAGTYKSEILDGRVLWDSDPLYRRVQDTAAAVQVEVIWRRRFYWEGDSVALSPITITNGTAGNTFVWSGIAGVLPAPVRLTLTNAAGVEMPTSTFYILNDAANTLGTAAFLTPATATVTWDGGLDHNMLLWPLSLPSEMMAAVAGERYRILAAFSNLPSSVYVRASVYAYVDGVYMLLQRGSDVPSGGRELLDLGALNLPPSGDIGTPSSLMIVLTIYSPAAGTATLSFVQVSPAEPAVTLYQNGFILEVGDSVVYDGMDEVSYLAMSQRHAVVYAAGELVLYPGQSNRLRVLFDEGVNFVPTRQLQVSGAYRPRKLTV